MQSLESENRSLEAENKRNEYKILDFHKEERILKNELQSGVNEVEAFNPPGLQKFLEVSYNWSF